MSAKSIHFNQFKAALDKIKVDELRWSEIKKQEESDGIWVDREDGSKVLKDEEYKKITEKWKNFYNT